MDLQLGDVFLDLDSAEFDLAPRVRLEEEATHIEGDLPHDATFGEVVR